MVIGEMGLGRCVFTNKGFLEMMGMGDRGEKKRPRTTTTMCQN